MGTDLTEVSMDSIEDVLAEIHEASIPIPFENSDYQTRAFVIASQQTPARAYRAILLQMNSKINALREAKCQQELAKIDIEEMEEKVSDPSTNPYERRRIQIKLKARRGGEAFSEKLVGDAIRELNVLYREFKKLPRYSREEFEREEEAHYKLRLERQVQHPGPLESLCSVVHDLPEWDSRVKAVTEGLLRLREGK